MKFLKIKELSIMSISEQTARRVEFDPHRTLVFGGNQTGKSSLLKTIYWTFGAEPAVLHERWKKAEIAALARFEFDNEVSSILRYGNAFGIFDSRGQLESKQTRVTGGLGAFLAERFNFRLTLPSRENEAITPPPAFQFLPYYIDQDSSWNHNWAGFANLRQFANWRRDLAEFHMGIRPNDYYLLKAQKTGLQASIGQQELEKKVVADVLQRMRTTFKSAEFDVDIKSFENEIARLVQSCNGLLATENRYKEKYTELNNERTQLLEQMAFTKRAAADLGQDYQFATDELREDSVPCPVCGTEYQNSFSERFALAADEGRLLLLIAELSARVAELDREITTLREKFRATGAELEEIRQQLESRREAVTLAEVLRSEGKREADAALNTKLGEIQEALSKNLAELRLLSEQLKNLTDKKRTHKILATYRELMKRYLRELRVATLPERSYLQVQANITEQGSNRPRALLAYYFSVLHTIRSFGDGTFFPIVIDSPNQQAQDPANLATMLGFIRDNQPEGSQVVLALESDLGVQLPGRRVELTQKHQLLVESEYESVRGECTPLLNRMLSDNPGSQTSIW